MTLAAFKQQMDRLAGLKFAPASLQTHYEALKDMPEALLAEAVTRAQSETSEFPSPKMLKVYADMVRARVVPLDEEPDRGVDLPTPREIGTLVGGLKIIAKREWSYYCDRCSDSGWQSYFCGPEGLAKPWQVLSACNRNREHEPHEFVVPCPCAEDNPDVQRRRERERQGGSSRRAGNE